MSSIRSLLPFVALSLFCAVLFFHGLGDRDLTSSHEARTAQNAQMILDEGHWLVPRLFDQHLELQKPPMYYWLVALLGWMRGGVDAWAVRLPAALSALATVLFVYVLGVQTGRQRVGLIAALILASCLHFTWLAHVGRIDMPLTMTVTFALGSFHVGHSRERRFFWLALGYTSLGAGLLLKGPIAVVLPASVVAAVWLQTHRLDWRAHINHLGKSSLWWGIPWMLAIAAPWYVWANWKTNNQLWEVFFWYHNVERGLGGAEALRAYPWWFYLPRAFVDLLPWSLFVPVAAWGAWRERETLDEVVGKGLLWFGGMLFFLSLMQFKRADYLLPAYPGLALFLAGCADRQWKTPTLLVRGSFGGLLVAYAIGWLVYHHATEDWPYRTMAQEIRRQTQDPIIFFRAESHVLAYHLGKPVATVLEWENLAIWAQKPFPVYFVMKESAAREWQQHLPAGALQEVMLTSDYARGPRDRALVILRNRR